MVITAAAVVALAAIEFQTGANRDNNSVQFKPSQLDTQQQALRDKTSDSATDAVAELSPPTEPPWPEQIVKKGETLSQILTRAGYSDREIYNITSEPQDGESLVRLLPGETIALQPDDSGELVGLRHIKSPLESVTYLRTSAGFESHTEILSPEPRETWATGTINTSLFVAGEKAGLSQRTILAMANIFGGVIDFALDTRKGDTVQLFYEELFLNDKKFEDGDIIAASYTNQGETFNAFRYTDASGDTNYYNEDGVSMRKAFLMAPLDFTRVSSNFNLRRLHPIYKTVRPHRGTDYAAPTGTPVYAAGDGRVIRAGYTRSNGNYVVIAHGEQYVTKYLHLHKRKVKAGQRVSQSQVIGTVGSTGAATGPHLHYEFLMNNKHRNPRTVYKYLPKASALPTAEMADFRQTIDKANKELDRLNANNNMATRTPPRSDVALN
ncbi:MAG: peptidoglycan DD-metalloendopeptidase family protein [Halioglobus sp.]|nr:peptidoglycan DD-metalloendopeptidase family protein [Halioglobus sp.]